MKTFLSTKERLVSFERVGRDLPSKGEHISFNMLVLSNLLFSYLTSNDLFGTWTGCIHGVADYCITSLL